MSPRNHFTEQPAPWVAAVCDRGIRHVRNEDAVAVAAGPEPGDHAVLVVCDGVSSSTDSDVASLAAARAARDVLVRAPGIRSNDSVGTRVAASTKALVAAANAANDAVIANTAAGPGNPASCTFVAAVLDGADLTVGWVGDSRAYWLPDAAAPRLLTIDDSFAAEQIADGMPRAEAENGPQAHAITRWLGIDAPDHTPRTVSLDLDGPGWLLVCSDGLWNYCSEAQDLAALVADQAALGGARAARAGRRPGRLGQRPGRPGQHHRGPRPRRRPLDPAPRSPPPSPLPCHHRSPSPPERKPSPMATFSADVYQNEFLPDGGTDVHAIVTVTCSGAGEAGQSGAGDAAEIVIVDTSGSMSGDEHRGRAGGCGGGARPGARRHVVRGDRGQPPGAAGLPAGRALGHGPDGRHDARARQGRGARSSGPTAARRWAPGSPWPTRLFAAVPSATQRHAILLTDGDNQHETPEQLTSRDRGRPRPVPVRLPRRRRRPGRWPRCAASPPPCSAAST